MIITCYFKPGIFLISSDIVVTFKYDQQIASSKLFGSNENDLVLISHKSSLKIAKDHGVYVIDEINTAESIDGIDCFSCKFVLQKPSIDKMKTLNVVLSSSSEEFVYTGKITKIIISFNNSFIKKSLNVSQIVCFTFLVE